MEKLPCFEHTVLYMRLQTYITKIHSQIQFGEGCVSTNNWRTYTHTHTQSYVNMGWGLFCPEAVKEGFTDEVLFELEN